MNSRTAYGICRLLGRVDLLVHVVRQMEEDILLDHAVRGPRIALARRLASLPGLHPCAEAPAPRCVWAGSVFENFWPPLRRKTIGAVQGKKSDSLPSFSKTTRGFGATWATVASSSTRNPDSRGFSSVSIATIDRHAVPLRLMIGSGKSPFRRSECLGQNHHSSERSPWRP